MKKTDHIIAPIRKIGEAKRKAIDQDAPDVAGALINIRTLLYAEAGKAEVLTEQQQPTPLITKTVGRSLRSQYNQHRIKLSLGGSSPAKLPPESQNSSISRPRIRPNLRS